MYISYVCAPAKSGISPTRTSPAATARPTDVDAEQRSSGTMQVWAEPPAKLRLRKTFNRDQDSFERADITSNTFWDWNLNHVGQIYGAMDDVFEFVKTFKAYPPRSFPPSFVPTNIMEQAMDELKRQRFEKRALARGGTDKCPCAEGARRVPRNRNPRRVP